MKNPTDDDPWRAELAESEICAQQFVGLDRKAAERLAEQLDRPLRVIDERTEAITLDLRENRINIYVEKGVVVRADAG